MLRVLVSSVLAVAFAAQVQLHRGETTKEKEAAGAKRGSSRFLLGHRSAEGRTPSTPQVLTLDHLAKCGGSYVKVLIGDGMAEGHEIDRVKGQPVRLNTSELKFFDVVEEWEALRLDRSERGDFVIGLIRNPFEYYVSLWAFTSEGVPGASKFYKATEADADEVLDRSGIVKGDSREGRAKFEQWMKEIMSDDIGEFSLRFYGSYLDIGKELLPHNHQWHTTTVNNFFRLAQHGPTRARVSQALRNFDIPSGRVDCWVRTENLKSDAEQCIQTYLERNPSVSFDWETFRQTDVQHNTAPHAPCHLFYSQELRDMVLRADAELIRAFDYPQGCNSHDEDNPNFYVFRGFGGCQVDGAKMFACRRNDTVTEDTVTDELDACKSICNKYEECYALHVGDSGRCKLHFSSPAAVAQDDTWICSSAADVLPPSADDPPPAMSIHGGDAASLKRPCYARVVSRPE